MTDRELMQQALGALEKLRVGLLTMQKHAESYGESWARAYVKEYRDMLPGAAEQQFRALNAMQHRLSDVAEGVIEGFDAIVALRQRLEQPEQEPVAWPCHIIEADFSERTITLGMESGDYKVSAGTHYLSTTQPQRTWVGLTDEEMVDLQDRCGISIHQSDFEAIEAKLKEKNT